MKLELTDELLEAFLSIPISSIDKLVDYLYDAEQLNYNGERDHIFRSVKRVAKWLEDLNDKNPKTMRQRMKMKALQRAYGGSDKEKSAT
jgi:hypothetical protein